MGWLKKITKSDRVQAGLCWVGAQYLRFIYHTNRWTVINPHIPETLRETGQPFIIAFWHGRLLLMSYAWPLRKSPIHMLISNHSDGKLIANTVKHIGIQPIQGSTNKGGAAALRTMVKTLKNGHSLGITPDGPRGPHMHASAGVISLAKMAQVPIVPCAVGTTRRKHAKSWDHFMIPWPFGRGAFVWGAPITVPKDMSYQDQVAAAITEVTRECDSLTGHTTREQARP